MEEKLKEIIAELQQDNEINEEHIALCKSEIIEYSARVKENNKKIVQFEKILEK